MQSSNLIHELRSISRHPLCTKEPTFLFKYSKAYRYSIYSPLQLILAPFCTNGPCNPILRPQSHTHHLMQHSHECGLDGEHNPKLHVHQDHIFVYRHSLESS